MWSNLRFVEETHVVSIEVDNTHLIWSSGLVISAEHLSEPCVQQQKQVHAGCEQVSVCGLPEGPYTGDAGRAAPRQYSQEVSYISLS